MHKKVASMAAWIKRRARVLQRAYSADRATAVLEATLDWYRFNGKALPNRAICPVQEEVSA